VGQGLGDKVAAVDAKVTPWVGLLVVNHDGMNLRLPWACDQRL
jgi:hypothetical protein